jgi:hypothetical protein
MIGWSLVGARLVAYDALSKNSFFCNEYDKAFYIYYSSDSLTLVPVDMYDVKIVV